MRPLGTKSSWFFVTVIAIALMLMGQESHAQSNSDRIKRLESALQELLKRDKEKDRVIRKLLADDREKDKAIKKLRTEVKALAGGKKTLPTTVPAKANRNRGNSIFAQKIGDTVLRLNSIDVNAALTGGYTLEDKGTSRMLQGGGNNPSGTGISRTSLGLSMSGSVDGYFDGELHAAYNVTNGGFRTNPAASRQKEFQFPFVRDSNSKIQVEEAFLRTNSLPAGLEIEAGYQLLEFGAFNPQHVHDWDFIDQPVIMTRMFGGRGISEAGIRLGWKGSDIPLGVHLGAYDSRGETMKSFLSEVGIESTIGGRPVNSQSLEELYDLVYLARLETHTDIGRESFINLGISGLTGPNPSGTGGNEAFTQIYGIDFTLQSILLGDRKFDWQTEFLFRDYVLDQIGRGCNVLELCTPRRRLRDFGFYTQAGYEFAPKFAVGLRYEFVTGEDSGLHRSTDDDRSDRHRLSPLFRWDFSPLGDLRLQYNFDEAVSLNRNGENTSHAVWLGLRYGLGGGQAFWASE